MDLPMRGCFSKQKFTTIELFYFPNYCTEEKKNQDFYSVVQKFHFLCWCFSELKEISKMPSNAVCLFGRFAPRNIELDNAVNENLSVRRRTSEQGDRMNL
jgi:hypothetical protein